MEVIAVIGTINLNKFVFGLLLSVTVIVAVLFVLLSKNFANSIVSAQSGDDKPVLVIDPGHGGEDGGAVSLSGVHESKINLDIALKMAALCGLTGLEYTLTRDSEEISYPDTDKSVSSRKKYDQKRRAELINGTPRAVLISVHQNCYPHSSPHGPQTFYSKNTGSDVLAKLIQDSMNTAIAPGNRRIAMPVAKNIFLYKNIGCTAVLAECGFISNPAESRLLDTETYRLKIAAVLTCAYLQYLDSNEN